MIFPKSVFSFDSMSEALLPEQKKLRNTKINPAIRKKNITAVKFNVFTVFLGEHVKSLRQQCSWLDQKKSVMFRTESVFFRNDHRKNQLFSELIQYCSEFIRVYLTEQNNVSSFISWSHSGGGGTNDVQRITSKSISGIKHKAMPSSSSIIVHCVLVAIDLDVTLESL